MHSGAGPDEIEWYVSTSAGEPFKRRLPLRNGGQFLVASGSRPGATYSVQATPDLNDLSGWACKCRWAQNGGSGCSHVRAAHAEAVRLLARNARQAVAA